MASRITTNLNAGLGHLVALGESAGLIPDDVFETIVLAERKAQLGTPEGDAQAAAALRLIRTPSVPDMDTAVLQDLDPDSKVLGIHLGSPLAVDRCPFGRAEVGVVLGENNPQVLVERSFAEWRTAQTNRKTVVIFKAGRAVLIYRGVTWAKAPLLQPNGAPRDFVGRHYIASAEVTVVESRVSFSMRTAADKHGFIRPVLDDERPTGSDDELLNYVAEHRRTRPAVQQPIDKLES